MKNDYREFYDEDYILHSMSEEEYISHSEWASNLRKYVDKIRTRTGKWKYIYPEDLKNKVNDKVKAIKRDADYAIRNTKHELRRRKYENKSADNLTFINKTMPYRKEEERKANRITKVVKEPGKDLKLYPNLPNYEKIQKKSREGLVKYAERHQQELEKEKRAKNIKYKQTDYSKVMDKNEKRKKLASYMKAANKGSTYSKLSSSTKDSIKRNLNSNIPDDRNIKVTYKSKYRSKFQTTTPTEKFGKLKTERNQWNDSLKRYRKLTAKEKHINKKGR